MSIIFIFVNIAQTHSHCIFADNFVSTRDSFGFVWCNIFWALIIRTKGKNVQDIFFLWESRKNILRELEFVRLYNFDAVYIESTSIPSLALFNSRRNQNFSLSSKKTQKPFECSEDYFVPQSISKYRGKWMCFVTRDSKKNEDKFSQLIWLVTVQVRKNILVKNSSRWSNFSFHLLSGEKIYREDLVVELITVLGSRAMRISRH